MVHRVELTPAWVLHRYPWRETSLIVEMLTREHGRVGIVARGARGKRRRGTPLQPFTPLVASFRQRGELATLTNAEATGPARNMTGNTFLAGAYVNELVLRLTARDDPIPEVFELYSDTLTALGRDPAPAVRRFEGRLIRTLGYALPLTHDIAGVPLEGEGHYRYDPDRGPQPAAEGYTGAMLLAIAEERFDAPDVLAAAARIFRDVIASHLGGRPLKSLEVARAYARHKTIP
jgi:DNA repair protein RecO (recombination protein O)